MIQVKNLTKQFGPKRAVDDLSFEVAKGEVLGFLGPNGAGKSTTMRMVTGYLPPTAGSVFISGIDALAEPLKAKAKVGDPPENAPLYEDMTVLSFIRFCAEVRGLYGADRDKAADRAMEITFLGPVKNQAIDTLSKGYRHRTCLAQSIVHDPEVLILDEPTDGLDPNQKHEVRSLIKRMGEGKVIVFSTHILEEVEAACTRAIIIDRGRVVADGSPADLKRRASNAGSVRVRIAAESATPLDQELSKLGAASRVEAEGGVNGIFGATVFPSSKAKDHELAGQISGLCAERKWKLLELHEEEGRLDDVFREITRPDTADHAG